MTQPSLHKSSLLANKGDTSPKSPLVNDEKILRKPSKRIGIFAGTFDPIHNGHISFALQAQKQANLDKIYFLPEPKPRYKPSVLSVEQRAEMIKLAIKPYPQLDILSLEADHFSVESTLPQLKANFGNAQLVYLFGSDVFCHIPKWPGANILAATGEFAVGIRHNDSLADINAATEILKSKCTVINSQYPGVSSKKIRDALKDRLSTSDTPETVIKYAINNKLYT